MKHFLILKIFSGVHYYQLLVYFRASHSYLVLDVLNVTPHEMEISYLEGDLPKVYVHPPITVWNQFF